MLNWLYSALSGTSSTVAMILALYRSRGSTLTTMLAVQSQMRYSNSRVSSAPAAICSLLIAFGSSSMAPVRAAASKTTSPTCVFTPSRVT